MRNTRKEGDLKARATEISSSSAIGAGRGQFGLGKLRLIPQLDWLLLALALGLALTGIFFIYSAGYRGPDLPGKTQWLRQLVWLVLGIVGMLVFALTDYRWLCRWGWIGYGGTVIILAGTVGAGFVMYGAKRWISFGWVGVQPSEFAKVGYLLALAGWLGAKERDPRLWKTVVQTLVILMVPFILIFKQPDFGSAMVLVPVTLAMLMVAGVPGRVFALMAAMGLALAPLAYWQMKDYQRARLVNFLKGEHAPRIGKFDSWNLVQSKIAIGSGGVWGKGWCKGSQSRLGFLPVASKDFIFAVFAEEEGFVGSGLLLLAYGLLLGLGFKIAVGATDRLGMLLATGVVTLLFTHVMVNIGMTIGMLPITGLPLPLFSYGGSFMVVTLLALGLLQSIRLHRRLY